MTKKQHAFTAADLANIRTACFTSAMRRDPKWREGLDAIADKAFALIMILDQQETRGDQ